MVLSRGREQRGLSRSGVGSGDGTHLLHSHGVSAPSNAELLNQLALRTSGELSGPVLLTPSGPSTQPLISGAPDWWGVNVTCHIPKV